MPATSWQRESETIRIGGSAAKNPKPQDDQTPFPWRLRRVHQVFRCHRQLYKCHCMFSILWTSPTNNSYYQGEHRHQWVKQTSRTRTNNRETDQQLGEMDYTLFHIEKIAHELRENGVSVPGRDHPLPSAAEPVPQATEVTISKGSRSSLYLPRWLHDHRYDPAAMVM